MKTILKFSLLPLLLLAAPVLETMRSQHMHLTQMGDRMDADAAETVLIFPAR